jgi:hypothetical protein
MFVKTHTRPLPTECTLPTCLTQLLACLCLSPRASTAQVFVLAAEELSKMTDMDELLVGR